MPLHALGGILEDDAHFLELISDSVRLCPVFLLAGVRARLNKSFNIAVESLGWVILAGTTTGRIIANCGCQHTGQLVEHGYRTLNKRL